MCKADKRIYKGVERGQPFEILVDGEKILAYEGETVGAALIAAGRRTLRHTNKHEQPRGSILWYRTLPGMPNDY